MKASIVETRKQAPTEFVRGVLYSTINYKTVVLCTETNPRKLREDNTFSGTVIYSIGGWQVGQLVDQWSADNFFPFTGKIELEQ